MDSGYMLKVEPMGFAKGMDLGGALKPLGAGGGAGGSTTCAPGLEQVLRHHSLLPSSQGGFPIIPL